MEKFLPNFRNLPARLSGEQVAQLLGFNVDQVNVLARKNGPLKPIDPNKKGKRFYHVRHIQSCYNNPKFLADAIECLNKHNAEYNNRKEIKQSE
ncbi:MAG: hypothetical protein AAFY98_11635 [Verrucomicrobiota bacterium]